MGYGKNLKKALDDNHMSVQKLAKLTGIAPTTLYSIIQRDTSVRFDHALRIANILGIDITQICKENPYDDGEVLPQPLSELNGLTTNLNKQTYIKNRTTPLLMLFDYDKMPELDQVIAGYFQLTDEGRSTFLDNLRWLMDTKTDKSRAKKLKTIRK